MCKAIRMVSKKKRSIKFQAYSSAKAVSLSKTRNEKSRKQMMPKQINSESATLSNLDFCCSVFVNMILYLNIFSIMHFYQVTIHLCSSICI